MAERSTREDRAWIDTELDGCRFADARLEHRFRALALQLGDGLGETIPMACQDWAATKAAYRFFSNDRISEKTILAGHFQATQARVQNTDGPVLVLHDTTELSFQRKDKQAIGITGRSCKGRDLDGRPRMHTVCGMLLHSSLVMTPEGLPLGIAAVKFWTRKKFKGCNALRKHINPTRIPIEQKESVRWIDNLRESTALLGRADRCVHIGDRESDIYELFCAAQECGTHFLVRTCVDRLAGNGTHTVKTEMTTAVVRGQHTVKVRDAAGKPEIVTLKIRYQRIQILPPVGKQSKYPPLTISVIHATEIGTPKGRERIEWKLATDLQVGSVAEAVKMIGWYASRWKIETFHKILKSGCRAESSRLRTAERLVRLIAVFCILSWRVFWMTMVNRAAAPAPVGAVFTPQERDVLDKLLPERPQAACRKSSNLSHYIAKVARLGGYLARTKDPPPGNIVIWRGLARLTDLTLGFRAAKSCG